MSLNMFWKLSASLFHAKNHNERYFKNGILKNAAIILKINSEDKYNKRIRINNCPDVILILQSF